MGRTKRYSLLLTKSEINKLYKFVNENKKSKTPIMFRHQLLDLYIHANHIVCQGV